VPERQAAVENVWYVAYGSNLRIERFQCYLRGGRPLGGAREYPGCRDPSDPLDVVSLEIGGGILFGGRSRVWTGGMAFYDASADGADSATVACSAYLLTTEQFADVAAQEIRHPPGSWTIDDIVHAAESGRPLGTGLYEKVVPVGDRGGVAMLTITCGAPRDLTLTPPAAAYLWTIGTGLRATHGWDRQRIGSYLSSAPGADGTWTAHEIARLLENPHPDLTPPRPDHA
jgi:hypothetical protein